MNIMSAFEMPKIISDGRLDIILSLLNHIKNGNNIELSFEKTEEITAAGHAILFVILDAACEQNIRLKVTKFENKKFNLHPILLQTTTSTLPQIQDLVLKEKSMIVYGKSSSIAPEFIQMLEQTFLNHLGEDRLWDVSLIFNELMQNTVDHSTAERYFLYAGITKRKFEFGVLDLGVTIPAKLEAKYICENDEAFLEKSLIREVGTRRNRKGGMGLFFLFESLKQAKGRLVILSRDAQIRKNFGTRNYISSKLKYRLSGTWCMGSFPLES